MVPGDETSAAVPGLEENKEYEFRVVPVNEAGPGTESEATAPQLTKNRKGKTSVNIPYLLFVKYLLYL